LGQSQNRDIGILDVAPERFLQGLDPAVHLGDAEARLESEGELDEDDPPGTPRATLRASGERGSGI